MEQFMIRFLISNLMLSLVIMLLICVKRLFQKQLTNRMQYNLWFILMILFVIPFVPIKATHLSILGTCSKKLTDFRTLLSGTTSSDTVIQSSSNSHNWMQDFTISVSRHTPPVAIIILFTIWLVGIGMMSFLLITSSSRLYRLQKSALPLQNAAVRKLYDECLLEINRNPKDNKHTHKNIPVYTTAFLQSPMITGIMKPRIYLPIRLVSDYPTEDLRYMLLHELQHARYHDALANMLMNLATTIYWFNPFVWLAKRCMHDDRELACDTSVLNTLEDYRYEEYGNTLLNLIEKNSLLPFPFASGISGNKKQIRQRIVNIASYAKPNKKKQLRSVVSFLLITILLFSLIPALSAYATDDTHFHFQQNNKQVSDVDLSSYFQGYHGSFVLYNLEQDSWTIYNMEQATTRVSPDSTYKIYAALYGLEEQVITPTDSDLAWNHTEYPFAAWNADQDLHSAMNASVNWYFQDIDQQLGTATVQNYLDKLEYGNHYLQGDLSSYWLESSLKISPIEQVVLLKHLYCNDWEFSQQNVNAVKESIHISSEGDKNLYGKTGTGCVDGHYTNGWFIGYVWNNGQTYFFATNIQSEDDASGSNASDITLSILSDYHIW